MRDRIQYAVPILGILGIFALWAGYTAGVGLLIEKNLPDRTSTTTAALSIAHKPRQTDVRKRNCVVYPPYPRTVVCQARWMWHKQPGGWGFMGDLWQPHRPLPSPIPVGRDGNDPPAERGDTVGEPNQVLTEAAKLFVPRINSVSCADGPFGYGYTYPITGDIVIDAWYCHPLEQLLAKQVSHPSRQGTGAITLTHEAIHNMTWVTEAQTECMAFQLVDNVLRLWGEPKAVQKVVLPYAYKDHRAFVRAAPSYNDKKRCRPGGAWDLTPGDNRWP